jgi:hypothetical protein
MSMAAEDKDVPRSSSHTNPGRRGEGAVWGTMAVAMLLFGSRWVSYLGAPPLFLTDVLIGFAVWQCFASYAARSEVFVPSRPVSGPPTLAVLLAIWAAVRFIIGVRHDLVAVRDVVPYLYAGLALLAWAGVRQASIGARQRTKQLLFAALVGHGVWVCVVILAPNLPLALPVVAPEQELHVLGLRGDVDSALVGVLAALLLVRLLRDRKGQLLTLAGFAAAWVVLFSTASRAGLIGAFLANAYAMLATHSERGASRNRSLRVVSMLLLLVALVALILPNTFIGTRLDATVGVQTQNSAVAESAIGTARARSNAWQAMFSWTEETIPRTLFGAGMGTSIMVESGAAILLVNSADDGPTKPRSPHNYWLGTFARLGLLGALLAAFATLSHLRRGWQVRHQVVGDELMLIVVLVPLALLVPATLGVVLESPFGAVPFWWCLGATLAMTPPSQALGRWNNSRWRPGG